MSDSEADEVASIISATTHNSLDKVTAYPSIQPHKTWITQTETQISEPDGPVSPVIPLHTQNIQSIMSQADCNDDKSGNVQNVDDDCCSEMSEVLIPLKQKQTTETCISTDHTHTDKQIYQDESQAEMSQSLLPSTNIVDLTVDTSRQHSGTVYTQYGRPADDSLLCKDTSVDYTHHEIKQKERTDLGIIGTQDEVNAKSICNYDYRIENTQKSAGETNQPFVAHRKDVTHLECLTQPDVITQSQKSLISKQPRKFWKNESKMLQENTEDFFRWATTTKRRSQPLIKYADEVDGYFLESQQNGLQGRSGRVTRNGTKSFERNPYSTRSSQSCDATWQKTALFPDSQFSFSSSQTQKDKTSRRQIQGPGSQMSKPDVTTDKLNLRIGKLLESIDMASDREQEVIKTTVEHCMMKLQDNLEKKITDYKCWPHLTESGQLKNLLRIIQSNLTRIMMLYKKLEGQNKQPDKPFLLGMHAQHKKNLLSIVQRQKELVRHFKTVNGEGTPKAATPTVPKSGKETLSGSTDESASNMASQLMMQQGKEGIRKLGTDEKKSNRNTMPKLCRESPNSLTKEAYNNSGEAKKTSSGKALKRIAEHDEDIQIKKQKEDKEIETPRQTDGTESPKHNEECFSDQDVDSEGSETVMNIPTPGHDEVAQPPRHDEVKDVTTTDQTVKSHSEMLWLNMLNNDGNKQIHHTANKNSDSTKDKEHKLGDNKETTVADGRVDYRIKNKDGKLEDNYIDNVADTQVDNEVEDITEDASDVDVEYISESDSLNILTATKVDELVRVVDDECEVETQQDKECENKDTKDEKQKNERATIIEDNKAMSIIDDVSTIRDVKDRPTTEKEKPNKADVVNENKDTDKENGSNIKDNNDKILSRLPLLEKLPHAGQVSPTSTCISSDIFMVKTQELERRHKQRMLESTGIKQTADGILKGSNTQRILGNTGGAVKHADNVSTSGILGGTHERLKPDVGGNKVNIKLPTSHTVTQRNVTNVMEQRPSAKSSIVKMNTIHVQPLQPQNRGNQSGQNGLEEKKILPVLQPNKTSTPQVIVLNPQCQQTQPNKILVVTKPQASITQPVYKVEEAENSFKSGSRTNIEPYQSSRSNKDMTCDLMDTQYSQNNEVSSQIQNSASTVPAWRDLFAKRTILPGQNVLSIMVKGIFHKASLKPDGKICDSRGVTFNTPVKWMSSLNNGQNVKMLRAYQQIQYKGKPLLTFCKTFNQQNQHNTSSKLYNTEPVQETLSTKRTTSKTDQITQTELSAEATGDNYSVIDTRLNQLLSTSLIKLLKKEDFVSTSDLPDNFWTEDYSQVKLCKQVWDSVTLW